MAEFGGIFKGKSPDASVWHGHPGTFFAVAHQQLFPAVTAKSTAQSDVDTSAAAGMDDSRRRAPSYCIATVRAVLAEALALWCEKPGFGEKDFVREESSWTPEGLRGVWRGGELEITFSAAGMTSDRICFHAEITNKGKKDFSGTLVAAGDRGQLNSSQAWYQHQAQYENHGTTVSADRSISIGLPPDFFSMFEKLAPDQRCFHWNTGYYRFAFCLDDGFTAVSDPGERTWKSVRPIRLGAGESICFQIGFAGKFSGRTPLKNGWKNLTASAKSARDTAFPGLLRRNRAFWKAFYQKVPKPDEKRWNTKEIYYYYKAWTSIYFNLWPAGDLILCRSPKATVCCNRCSNGPFVYPASWETSIGAILLGMIRPRLGEAVLESLTAAIRPDGFLAEAPGYHRFTQLPSMECAAAFLIYRAGKSKAFARRVLEPLLRNLRYKFNNPNWRHLTGPSVRNYAYAVLGAAALRQLAKASGASEAVLRELDTLVEDGKRVIDGFYDPEKGYYNSHLILDISGHSSEFSEGTNAEALLPLFPGLHRKKYRKNLLALIRREFLTDSGLMRRAPRSESLQSAKTVSRTEVPDWTIKESNLFYLLPALRVLDEKLADRLAKATVDNIAGAGDFYECYTADGQGRHNGPGGIFGAFAVIWCVLNSDGVLKDFCKEFSVGEALR